MVQNPFQSRAFLIGLAAIALGVLAGAFVPAETPNWVVALVPGALAAFGLLYATLSLPAPRGASLPASALREAGDGKKPRRPAEITPQEAELYDALDEIARSISDPPARVSAALRFPKCRS